jgi:hypothetical protein
MKFRIIVLSLLITGTAAFSGTIEKTFTFSQPRLKQNGAYTTVELNRTMQAGLLGEPSLPYHQVALMLPPGESATAIQITGEELTWIPGRYELFPRQASQPLSKGPDGIFRKNEAVYQLNADYPARPAGRLINSTMNGFSFALSTFTPVVYNPARGAVAWYKKVTVRITTQPDRDASNALKNISSSLDALRRVKLFAQNPEMTSRYPEKSRLKSDYEILIITRQQFIPGYQDLVNYYNGQNRPVQVATTENIQSTMTGADLAEKIRNYIIQEYQNNSIEHVVLGGDIEHVPYRGFYCYVISGSGYEDYNIPADIYFSALDGNWNTNGDGKWGEPGEDDLLPEISVGRMSFSNTTELANMVHKSVSYQHTPVAEEMKQPYLVSEFLYDPPLTWGSDYLELLVDEHTDNGYLTHGIPSAINNITRLYDTLGYNWGTGQLFEQINEGKSFIHHSGHSNSNYMMRLYNWDITNQNFSQVDGIHHNYQLMYTHGCICGAFDDNDCISEKATTIANWLVAGVFNSRYGWFNQGETEGPSAHIHREFISALYHPDPDSAQTTLGMAHTMSKIKTAPWIGLPGEFEPGAQRWCFYDCNALGDPALVIWTDNPIVGITALTDGQPGWLTLLPNPARESVTIKFNNENKSAYHLIIINQTGQTVHASQGSAAAGSQSLRVDITGLAPGVYFCRLDNGTATLTGKLIVTR